MTVVEKISGVISPSIVQYFPFDIIKMTGSESVDFLQRITTNDFTGFTNGNIQKTLLVTDKGRIIDAVWIIHRNDYLLMLASKGMAAEIISWLNKYIIIEDISLTDVTQGFEINLHINSEKIFYHLDYFGFPASFELKEHSVGALDQLSESFEQWRIENGIPKTKKEVVQDFNPLELNLWSWISFTKGCYIGQEIIARLDTYNKIQRTLCKFSSSDRIHEQEILLDENGAEIGKITSVTSIDNKFIGLSVVRVKLAVEHQRLKTKNSNGIIEIEKVFQKEVHGRN